MHNLKFDKKVAVFSNASGAGAKNTLFLSSMAQKQATSECTTLSFRTGSFSLFFMRTNLTYMTSYKNRSCHVFTDIIGHLFLVWVSKKKEHTTAIFGLPRLRHSPCHYNL